MQNYRVESPRYSERSFLETANEYSRGLASELEIPRVMPFSALDLFSGCGGLALGFESMGFSTIGLEKKPVAVSTYNANLRGHSEVVDLSPSFIFPSADVVIGGPPCQPFSLGGLQMGLKDSRDGFPAFIKAIEQVMPELWLFENVKGMLFRNRAYFLEITEKLRKLGYQVEVAILNASWFGVPQNRERLIVVGHHGGFAFPDGHGAGRVTAGDALGALALEFDATSKFLTEAQDRYIATYEEKSKCVTPRDLHLDKISRTLTCRNLAGATSDMQRVKLPDGRRRRLSVREAARLQSFPDNFVFLGNESQQFEQIGNAVPPLMARALAKSVRSYLEGSIAPKKPSQYLFEIESPDTVRWHESVNVRSIHV